MYKYLFKPIGIILGIYLLPALGVASDIAQLTEFNIIILIRKHSPKSYYLIIVGTILLYLLLVLNEFVRTRKTPKDLSADNNNGQLVKAQSIRNSTIIQISKDKEV